MTKYRRRALSLDRQLGLLKLRDPSGKGNIRDGKLTWRWIAQPTPVSRSYALRLDMVDGTSPKIFVESPCLRALADSREIPHLYSQADAQLCLYLPSSGEWNGTLALANTIVAWTSLWLFFFEEWLLSNEWKGGGVHPPASEAKSDGGKKKKRKLR